MRTKQLCLMTMLFISITCNAQIPTGFKNSSLFKLSQGVSPEKILQKGQSVPIYKTENIIRYNYDSLEIARKQPKLDELSNDLYNNSKGLGTRYSEDTIKNKMKRRAVLEKEIERLTKHKDSLYHCYTKDYVQYHNSFFLNFGPQKSRAFFDILYDNKGNRFKALGNSGINFGNNTGSIFSELVSGNLGLFRVSLGTMISNNSSNNETDQKSEEAYQKLVSYGGNTVLSFEYPLAYLHSSNNRYNLISRIIAKGTSDLPAFGTNTDNWAGSASGGIDLYCDAALDNESLRFFFNANCNAIYGTKEFIKNLEINNSQFLFGQITVGFTFLENFKISLIVTTFSSETNLRNKKPVVGGQVMR